MGRKTSVWLADELAERVRASGVPLGELVRRGLDAGEPPPLELVVRGAVEAAMREVLRGDYGAVQAWREQVTPPVRREVAEAEAVPARSVHKPNCKCFTCKPPKGSS